MALRHALLRGISSTPILLCTAEMGRLIATAGSVAIRLARRKFDQGEKRVDRLLPRDVPIAWRGRQRVRLRSQRRKQRWRAREEGAHVHRNHRVAGRGVVVRINTAANRKVGYRAVQQPTPNHQTETFSSSQTQVFECEALSADHPEIQARERARQERLQLSNPTDKQARPAPDGDAQKDAEKGTQLD